MNDFGWLDRSNYKSQLSNWINTESSIFAISVNDSQELTDIDSWLKEEFSGWKTAQASFANDKEILKFSLLELLVYDLGLKNFYKFKRTLKKLDKNKRINAEQSLGNQAKSKEKVQYDKNVQNLYLESSIFQRSLIYENNITQILHAFISDLEKFSKDNKILILIKCRMDLGDESFSDFLNWLQDRFFYLTCRISNIKIVIFMQDGLGNFYTLNDDQICYLPSLNIEDIRETIELYTAHYKMILCCLI